MATTSEVKIIKKHPKPVHASSSRINKRENVLSGAGKKEVIYATNQELPRHIFNEASVHSIM